jgi:hypothetical protein
MITPRNPKKIITLLTWWFFLVFKFDLYTPHRFATGGVVDSGGKLPPVSATPAVPVKNLPLVSLIPVANLPLVSLNLRTVSVMPVVQLDLRISPRIFEKYSD